MQNMTMNVDADQILTIKVDLKQRNGRSASGKTTIIATSAGNKPVPNSPAIIGLNVYTKE